LKPAARFPANAPAGFSFSPASPARSPASSVFPARSRFGSRFRRFSCRADRKRSAPSPSGAFSSVPASGSPPSMILRRDYCRFAVPASVRTGVQRPLSSVAGFGQRFAPSVFRPARFTVARTTTIQRRPLFGAVENRVQPGKDARQRVRRNDTMSPSTGPTLGPGLRAEFTTFRRAERPILPVQFRRGREERNVHTEFIPAGRGASRRVNIGWRRSRRQPMLTFVGDKAAERMRVRSFDGGSPSNGNCLAVDFDAAAAPARSAAVRSRRLVLFALSAVYARRSNWRAARCCRSRQSA